MKRPVFRIAIVYCASVLSLCLIGSFAARAQQDSKSTASSQPVAATQAPGHKIIFLGDRRTHRGQTRAEIIIPVMKQRGIEIEYTEDVDILASPKLNEYDGLILYADIRRATPEQEAGLLAFVENGKGFIPIHSASACFGQNEKLIALIGAQFVRHGGEVFSTRLVEANHPVMKGFGGFESWDETYVHRNHNDANRTVLEWRDQGTQAEGQSSEPWTWVRTQGKGRVFYTAWGHDQRTWNNPGFQNLIERGIRWAVGGDPGVVPAFAGAAAMAAVGQAGDQNAAVATAVARQAIAERPPFVAPKVIEGPGKIEDITFHDVGPAVPIYAPRGQGGGGQGARGGQRNGAGREHYEMPEPLPAEKSINYFTIPEGFKLELFASEPVLGPKPISINWDARGRMWVCETIDYPNEWRENGEGRDRIRIVEDTDNDGRADKTTVFAENLSIPYTLAFYRGGVIVQNGGYTIYLKDTNGDDKADVRKTLITGWNMRDTHGAVSNFQYGLDNWIYAMQGYNSSSPKFTDSKGVEHTIPTFRQGFFRFRLDGSDDPSVEELEFLRSTNNNTWGLGITEEGLIFGSTANGNPSVFMPIANRYYERVRGWSADTLQRIADTPRFNAATDRVRQVDNFNAYTAGAGKAIYTARVYPQQWWNRTAFVAEPTGHLVGVFVLERDGAGYRSSSPMNLVASRDEWTAPIQAEVGPDGNVWILDWYNYIVQHNPTPPGFQTGVGAAYESELRDKKHGRVYRLKYVGSEGQPSSPMLNLEKATPQQLVEALRHPTKLWRLHAQRLLVERGQADVVPALVANAKDATLDAIGLNVGVIHAMGALQGLVAFNPPAQGQAAAQPAANARPDAAAAVDVVRSNLTHPSPGVRRNAIALLPKTTASVDALFAANLLNDPDVQVKLAAILALSDLPPTSRGAETIAQMLASATAEDRWLADALYSAAAMHGIDFVKVLARNFPRGEANRQIPEAISGVVSIVAEHLARGEMDGARLGALLDSLAAMDSRLASPALFAISTVWPLDRKVQLPSSADDAIAQLLKDVPFESRSDMLRLARLWNAGNTAELQKEHSDALKALVANTSLSDEERISAAQAWVRFDPDSGIVGQEIVRMITPQTPLPLLTGLLQAASGSKPDAFAAELVTLYQGLLPAGRQAVLKQMLTQPETTAALLDAFAANEIDPSVLSLEQIAALRGHANEALRNRATELIAAKGSSPNPDRQKVYDELVSVAEVGGNAARGKELFTKNCAVCHMHGGVGETIAPDLTGMFVHPKKDILANIIDPSKDVESNFRSYSVIANGKTYVGMFAGESRTNVTIVDSTGKRDVIQRDEIDEIFASNKSLMPDGFEKVLSKSDLSDVLEFLATPQRYVPLRLSVVATTSSVTQQEGFGGFGQGRGQGRGQGGRGQGRGRGQDGRGRGQGRGDARGAFGQIGDQGGAGAPSQGAGQGTPGAEGARGAAGPGQGADRGGRGQADGRGRGQGRGLAGRGQGRQGRGGRGGGRGGNLIAMENWKPVTVDEIPFTLIDPQAGAVKNVILFGSDVSRFSRELPTSVKLPVGMPAKTLHLLSGVSIGGYPDHPDQTTSLIVRLHYQGGETEDHELKNGVHFAAYDRREDVPESTFAFAMEGQQMRHVKVTPRKSDTIVDVEFIKGDDPTVPLILAVTAELPPMSGGH